MESTKLSEREIEVRTVQRVLNQIDEINKKVLTNLILPNEDVDTAVNTIKLGIKYYFGILGNE